jgi:PAT family beta-lactamase induction signal transducer AmpG
MEEGDRGSRWILSESRQLRMVAFFLLYFGQGLPVGLTTVALPAWVAANGGSEPDVAAIIAAAILPWSFKFIVAALMDRYAFLPMGRRRAWLIGAQALMAVAFLIAALVNPGAEDVALLWWVAFIAMAGAATQDVAVDGLAVDILPDDEQGTASAFMFGGQALGSAAAGAAGGYALQAYGPTAAFMVFIPLIVLLIIFSIAIIENRGERRYPWSTGQPSATTLEAHTGEWKQIFLVTLRSLLKRDSTMMIVATSCVRTMQGMLSVLWPVLATQRLAYTTASYAAMFATMGLIGSVVSIGLGSVLTVGLGARLASVVVSILQAVICLFILGGAHLWLIAGIFVGATFVYRLLDPLQSIVTNPLRMQLSDKRVAATQFTIYNSLSNLPVALGATLFAALGGIAALSPTMLVGAGLAMLGAIGFFPLRVGNRHEAAEPVPEVN